MAIHHDLLRAKAGDAEARARIAVVERDDPARYNRACDEVGAILERRWSRRAGETEAEHRARVGEEVSSWFALASDPPILVGIPYYD